MSGYKLVPVEPTAEMLKAAACSVTHPENLPPIGEGWSMNDLAFRTRYQAALAAAPAVQWEPVAWVTADTVDGQTVNGKPRRVWWENNEGVGMPIYTAPQPAEQQPSPDVAGLVEALELIEKGEGSWGSFRWKDCHNIAVEALAAYRKGGDTP